MGRHMWTWLIVSVNEPIVHYQSSGKHSMRATSCWHIKRKRPPHAIPKVCTAPPCNCRWGLQKSSLMLCVLVEAAKLDRFAYTQKHTHTHRHSHNLNHSQLWRGGGGTALFVPGHLVKTPTDDLLLSSPLVINHIDPTLKHTQVPTFSSSQTIIITQRLYTILG